jgi:hypothetical protein
MSRSRLLVLVSMGAVAVGGAVALGALALGTSRTAVGPLPAEALPILADARYVMGLDARRYFASAFHRRYSQDAGKRPDALNEVEAKTGLSPERDVDHVFAAGGGPGDKRGVALIRGRFDRARITHVIETERKGVTRKEYLGSPIYLFGQESGSPGALGFLDDHDILLGTERGVEAVIARQVQRASPPPGAISGLVGRVKPGSTFWIVGDETVLSAIQGAAQTGNAMTLPALKSLVVTGDLDPDVTISIVGDAADAAGATNVADVVRGLVGLLSLQARQKPELAQLASAVTVATELNQIHVDARIPYSLVEALSPRRPASVPAPPGTAPERPR